MSIIRQAIGLLAGISYCYLGEISLTGSQRQILVIEFIGTCLRSQLFGPGYVAGREADPSEVQVCKKRSLKNEKIKIKLRDEIRIYIDMTDVAESKEIEWKRIEESLCER